MPKELQVSIAAFSDKGRKQHNQDFYGAKIPSDYLLSLKGVAIAMADGISSSDVSHIASQLAVNNFLDDYYCTAESWSVKKSAEQVINAINSWLYTQTRRGPHRYEKDKGYVCTFSSVILKNRTAHIFHLGDTRVYKINTQGIEQLTHDHRLWISNEQSCLSRALGMDDDCNLEYLHLPVKKGDFFMQATDGIYEFVDADFIKTTILEHAHKLDEAAKIIYQKAYDNNSNDNLSVQILAIRELPEDNIQDVKQKANQLPIPPALTARMEFDGYTILREIHTNNRSRIYLAEDNDSKLKVAIKVLSTELMQNDAEIENFLMEEWVARRVQSPHVLKASLPERKRNYLYTLFEFIEGQTLAQWATDNPKPKLETVRGLIEQIAKGLNAFHRMEMLHQDLRPENIMIDHQGTVKIIDFGSVSIAGIEETEKDTPLTYLKGTALYSAPEYFLGEPGTTQSDLFSIGVITYFLLSGKYPYGTEVSKTKTLSAQKKLNYQSLWDENREMPKWIDSAISKAVHPVPYKRHDEIFEFVHDLRHPNQSFLNKTKPALMEKNPVAAWQTISLILFITVIVLAYKLSTGS